MADPDTTPALEQALTAIEQAAAIANLLVRDPEASDDTTSAASAIYALLGSARALLVQRG